MSIENEISQLTQAIKDLTAILSKAQEPVPAPEPATEPTPEPTTEPTPEPTTEPTPEPTTEPTPEPATKPKAKKRGRPSKVDDDKPLPKPETLDTEEEIEHNRPADLEKGFTHIDVKNKLLEINRRDRTTKPRLLALLNEFGAKVASDLKEEDLPRIMVRLETGDY